MIFYICDRCGRNFTKELGVIKTTFDGSSFYYDICENCFFMFKQFVNCGNKQKTDCRMFIDGEEVKE